MKTFTVKRVHIIFTALLMGLLIFVQQTPNVHASPFGQGVFGLGKFGDLTSLTINLGGNVNVNLTGTTTFTGQGTHQIQVTSNDVVGYQIYVYSPSSTLMSNGAGNTIPASTNITAGSLATNTWGYNTSGSTTNYLGMTTSPVLLKSATGIFETPDATNVYYGVSTDLTQGAGLYKVNVIYTVVPLND